MAVFFELADVGARHEGLVAGADQDHDPHVRVLAQFIERVAEPFPHVERQGVALFPIVEGDDFDAVGDALQDLAVGMGFCVLSGTSSIGALSVVGVRSLKHCFDTSATTVRSSAMGKAQSEINGHGRCGRANGIGPDPQPCSCEYSPSDLCTG